MPRYYFDSGDGTIEKDSDGTELADLEEARTEAIKFAGELLRHQSQAVFDGQGLHVHVLDAARVLLFVVSISALDAVPGP